MPLPHDTPRARRGPRQPPPERPCSTPRSSAAPPPRPAIRGARARRSAVVQSSSNENPYGPVRLGALEAAGDAPHVATAIPTASTTERAKRSLNTTAWRRRTGRSSAAARADPPHGRRRPSAGRAEVVGAEPTFEAVLAYAKVVRADGVKVPLTSDFRHDLPKMAAACDASAGLVYVCNPNNPTATIVTGDEMAAFAAAVPASATILVDEAIDHFVEDARDRSSLELIGRSTRTSSSHARSPRFTGWRA